MGMLEDDLTDCGNSERTNIYDLHERMTAHLFPAYSSADERFLALALCGEAGELANMIKKRWRDGTDLAEQIRDEIADVRVYLELLAKVFGIEGDKLDERVRMKLKKVKPRRERLWIIDKGLPCATWGARLVMLLRSSASRRPTGNLDSTGSSRSSGEATSSAACQRLMAHGSAPTRIAI
jgi:NTP pyrophosphatase (non-canonical NTP hydrolase)